MDIGQDMSLKIGTKPSSSALSKAFASVAVIALSLFLKTIVL